MMTEMLNAKDMQSLLQVDRSTIYRMAESGRLPAVKVGKQWRFPAEQVEAWLQLQLALPVTTPSTRLHSQVANDTFDLASLIPLDCVQLIIDTFAELLGVMLVVTDIEGNPVARTSRPCGLFQVISEDPHALQKCIESWYSLANAIEMEPKFSQSYLGLLCSRALIRVGTELKGMVVAGCVAPEKWPPDPAAVERMAEEFGVPAERIQAHLDDVYYLDSGERDRVLTYLQPIANIVAHIVNERSTLMGRLAAIADLTTI